MGLQSLERRVERMVEGVFSRGSRGSIRPIELGRRLVREMDDQRSVDVKGRRVVPNDFTIKLAPTDLASFSDIHDALVNELSDAAREYAREEGYHFMGPVEVTLEAQDDLRPGRFEVVAQLLQARGGAPGGSLVLPSGERVRISSSTISVGRSSDCTVTLNDQNVSRKHAEVRQDGSAYVVVDLGSTNGTLVNGARIRGEHRLTDGDIIAFGSTYVRFEAS